MLTCPACHVAMNEKPLGVVQIHECPSCRSMWFQDGELKLAKNQADHDLVWLDFDIWKHPDQFTADPRHLACPACAAAQLVQVTYGQSGVTVDYCPSCRGLWLEHGAFRRIVDELEREVDSISASEYLKASLHEVGQFFTGRESLLSEWRDLGALLRLMELRFFVEHQGLTKAVDSLGRVG